MSGAPSIDPGGNFFTDPLNLFSGKGGDPAADPRQSNTDIGRLRQEILARNPQLFDISQMLIERGLGTQTDPLIEAQRARGLGALQGQLTRRGITGSVGLNQLGRLNQGFNESALGRRDFNLRSGFGLEQSGLQRLTVPAELSIAQQNAQNAGRSSGGKK